MTFLPIVERELRVAARKRSTYLWRVIVALSAMCLGLSAVVINPGLPGSFIGPYIFQGLAGLLLLFCLASGRLSTADCLSEEKREGTLGLLFLTDLKGYDVVLGKLAATSLRAFYGLLAVFPVLAVPLLLGGTSNGEFWRMVLVLVAAFLLSLAIGLLGSALCRDYRRAMTCHFALFFGLVAGPAAVAGAMAIFAPGHPVYRKLFLSCPVFSFYLCPDRRYLLWAGEFWWSIGVILGLAVLLVLLASWIVPHSWRDRPVTPPKSRWRAFWQAWSYGPKAKQAAFRRRLLERNPFYWLAARARLKPAQVWMFLGAMLVWWLCGWFFSGRVWLDESAFLTTALLLNSTIKVWLVLEATQSLAAEQKEGSLELLLSTPLSVKEILRGQLLALRRQFLGPILAVLAVELLFLLMLRRRDPSPRVSAMWLSGMAMLVIDGIALSWVGMACALKARSHYRAIAGTLARLLVLPWILTGAAAAVLNFLAVFGSFGLVLGWRLHLLLWLGFSLAADLLFGLLAWRQLRHEFRLLALRHLATTASGPGGWPGSTTAAGAAHRADAARQPAPPAGGDGAGKAMDSGKDGHLIAPPPIEGSRAPRRRRGAIWGVLLAGIALLLAAGLFFHFRSLAYPPPLVVNLASSNAPVRVFPSTAAGLFILPDGSLWQWGRVRSAPGQLSIPEQVSADGDWVQAASVGSRCLGLRRDGTIWEWGWRRTGFSREPQPADPGNDWTSIASGDGNYTVALRRGGTLWACGVNYGWFPPGPGSTTTNLTRLGTHQDWAAVACQWNLAFGLRSNGTVWAWGRFDPFTGNSVPVFLSAPTQVCAETNWVDFLPGPWVLVRNRKNELWEVLRAPPNASAPAAIVGALVATNASPGRFALAFCGQPKAYELRPDGTLWERACSLGPWTATPTKPRRVGKRSDWVSLWGTGGTAFGQTADGTLWVWGYDGGRSPVGDFRTLVTVFRFQIRQWLGARVGNLNVAFLSPVQKKPRPLLQWRTVPASPPVP